MASTNWKENRRIRVVFRGSFVVTAVGMAALLCLAGCGLTDLLGYIPTEEELELYNWELKEFNERVENLPLLAVRIVNNTDVIASVELESGMAGPEPDLFGDLPYLEYEEPYLTPVDGQTVLIAPGGTATGTIKCGEVIGVSAQAPFDEPSFDYGGDAFGLYVSPGNIDFSGIGSPGGGFEGDSITTTRFVRPAEDGVDCEADVLVIQIDTIATGKIIDEETGELLQAKKPGTGTLSVEPSEPEEG